MDKQELIEFLDGEIRSVKENIAFKEGMNWCAQLVERHLDLNEEPEITTEQAWEKIAEKFEEGPKELCATLVSALPPYNLSEKPEIPHWLAERTEEYNIDSSVEFWRYVFNGSIFNPEERAWILDNDDIINKIFLCGYTIEKEPVWVVKTFAGYLTDLERSVNDWQARVSSSKDDEDIIAFKCKEKANEIAELIGGVVKEWSE